MAILNTGDVLLYTVYSTYQGQRVINTWNFQFDKTAPGDIEYETFCDTVLGFMVGDFGWIDGLLPLLTPGYFMNYHTLQKIDPVRLRAVRGEINSMGTGAATGSTVNQAAVITKHGAEAARWAIGSWHQAGLPVGAYQADGTVNPTTLNSLRLALEALSETGVTSAIPGTNLQSILFNTADPTRKTAVTGMFAQSTARVMRRRTVGLGI